MKLLPKYWSYVDRNDGKGWVKTRQPAKNNKHWSFAMTYLQRNKLRAEAKRKGWKFKSQIIPTYKPPKQQTTVEYPNKTHITPNFTWKEAQSKDGAVMPEDVRKNVIKVARELEKVRDVLDKPIHVLSWYRSPARNTKVGGAKNSQHLYGRAVDIDMSNLSQDEVVTAAEQVPAFRNGGIGAYPAGGVHLDNRGYRARWSTWG